MPSPLPALLSTPTGAWLHVNDNVQPITRLQEQLLVDAGSTPTTATQAQIAAYPDLDPVMDLRLPEQVPMWVDPANRAVCVDQHGGVAAASYEEAMLGAAKLSGSADATHFAGLTAGSVGVDSGYGYHVVSVNGLRHEAPDAETLDVVGVARVDEVGWDIVALLPEGAELTREAALTATY